MNNLFPVITCEHAGNDLPEEFKHIFTGDESVLNTHRAVDFGALELAENISGKLSAPLYFTKTCRLLIEANRSLDADDLFSEFFRKLSDEKKQEIINTYYQPYRSKVEEAIKTNIDNNKTVVHISIHTFTPVLNGETRRGDVGLLFDPSRKLEQRFCKLLERELINADYRLVVKYNFPYLGTDDGFTTYLRNKFYPEKYLGIEIEVNQKYPLMNAEKWNLLRENISTAIGYATLKF